MSERKRDALDGRDWRDGREKRAASRACIPLDEEFRFRVRGKRDNGR